MEVGVGGGMTTYFAWVSEEETFDSKDHARCDLEVLKLEITQRESEVALARVIVPEAKCPKDKQRIFISYQKDKSADLLFAGRLVDLPFKIQNDLIQLEFSAEPDDAGQQLEKVVQDLKKESTWDELFSDPTGKTDEVDVLDAKPCFYCWDRVTGRLSLSDLFQGRKTIDLTQNFFTDSLKIGLADTPLSHVSVDLVAEWTQVAEGEINIFPKIAAQFAGGMVNTLTWKDFVDSWPKEGAKLGKSGYGVSESMLKLVEPPKTGVLSLYPTVSPELVGYNVVSQKQIPLRFRRFWAKGRLILSWFYRQKRREIVTFTLKQNQISSSYLRLKRRYLTLKLQAIDQGEFFAIEDRSRASFFLTDRGRKAVEHVLEMARIHLVASARCLEAEVEFPFELGIGISLDHSVVLEDNRIPGGKLTAKVIEYRLTLDGGSVVAWVRLAACPGEPMKRPTSSLPKLEAYVEEDYGEVNGRQTYETLSKIAYLDYSSQVPKQGIVSPKSLGVHDFVRKIWVANQVDSQVHHLVKNQYPVRQDLPEVLKEVPTLVSLDLLVLKTSEVAEHRIQVEVV